MNYKWCDYPTNTTHSHILQRCIVADIRCKFCGSKNVVKYGFKNHIQQYLCKDCGRKFNERDTLEGKHTPIHQMGVALSLFYDSLSVAEISQNLVSIFNEFVSPSTIYRWVMQYSQEAIKLLSQYKAKLSDLWVVDETFIRIGGDNYWFFDVIDEGTRFLVNTHLSQTRTIADVVSLFERCSKHTDIIPRYIISDKLASYIDGIERVFGSDAKHIQSQGMTSDININLIERFHSTLKTRLKVIRGLKTRESAEIILDGFIVNYNFFRPHMSLRDKTPAEVAGIKLPFDSWEGLLRSL